ncbi:MAG: hypothetical protein QGF90_09575 [Gammaproteobacteria bacterium]|jgi:hypothetical protein|nr:hypothetical protein [Gammaproteobacteria bacterium]|tara:strand:- start:338 stop:1090 length:753 start_codon:yes stop_codon:yes gene_type:complete
MEKDNQFSRLVSAQLLIALLVGGAYFLYDQPFQSSRTPFGESTDMFESRLWEDPLNTIYNIQTTRDQQIVSDGNSDGIDAYLNNQEIDKGYFLQNAHAAIGTVQSDGLNVIGVMVPEGQHSLTIETRRRIRYAAISALNQSKIPTQSERLPIVRIDLEHLNPSETKLISYEIYQPHDDPLIAGSERIPNTTVVLWIPAALLAGNIIENYESIVESLFLQTPVPGLPVDSNSLNTAFSKAILLGPLAPTNW